jgi:hypothetical protein
MRYGARRRTVTSLICLIMTVTGFGVPVNSAPLSLSGTEQVFLLKLKLTFLSDQEGVEIKETLRPGLAFSDFVTDKEGNRYYVGGTLVGRLDGKYRVVLFSLFRGKLGDEGFGTSVRDLELDKTVTVCSVDGIVHDCVATTLSRSPHSYVNKTS